MVVDVLLLSEPRLGTAELGLELEEDAPIVLANLPLSKDL